MDAFTYTVKLSNGLSVETAVDGAESDQVQLVQRFVTSGGARSPQEVVIVVTIDGEIVEVREQLREQ